MNAYREPGTREEPPFGPEYEERAAQLAEFVRLAMERQADQGCFVLALEHERKFS